jgi:hypothetical protein
MRRKSLVLSLVLVMLAVVAVVPFAHAQSPEFVVPVVAKAKSGPRMNGTFTIQRFVETGDPANPDAIFAVGRLALTTDRGQVAVKENVMMPVSFGNSAGLGAGLGGGSGRSGSLVTPSIQLAQILTCEILHLVLGPLDLNLLGLEVHLDTVDLLIEANPAGGLLGQLLCAIANLLSGGALAGVAALLNDLLALLVLAA